MAEEKYRVSAYVNETTYKELMDLQYKRKLETKKKVSQGQILDELFELLKKNNLIL